MNLTQLKFSQNRPVLVFVSLSNALGTQPASGTNTSMFCSFARTQNNRVQSTHKEIWNDASVPLSNPVFFFPYNTVHVLQNTHKIQHIRISMPPGDVPVVLNS